MDCVTWLYLGSHAGWLLGQPYINIHVVSNGILWDPCYGTVLIYMCVCVCVCKITDASLSITNSWSSLRLMSIKSVMPSSHLILCRQYLRITKLLLEIRLKEMSQNKGKKYVQRYVPKLWIYGYICICVYTYCVCIYIYTHTYKV